MTANYHTHTTRCHHASGSEREYIERALQNGLMVLGFSDHVPMPFPDGHQSGYRVRLEETENYWETLTALREEYRDRIRILIGYEAEYYPAYFDAMREFLSRYPYDYLLLGQHFVNNETDGVYAGHPTDHEEDLAHYVDHVLEGLHTGCYTYVAHPDLIHYVGEDAVYERHMRRLCEGCLRMEIPLEINLPGLCGGRHYPCDRFFRIAGEVGNRVVLGCDAHRVEDVADPEQLAAGMAFAARHGLTVCETVTLRDPMHPVPIG